MTSDRPDPSSWEQAPAAALRRIERCLESIANAEEAAAGNPEAAERFRLYGARKRLQAVDAALEVCDLQDRPAPRTHRPTDQELREHELRLGLPEGTFRSSVREPGPAETIRLRRGLEVARELAEAELRMSDPPKFDPGYVPAIVRICCATVIGALVGAPLGALAIHEDILKKMAEAAIVTGLGAIGAEFAGPLSARAERSPEPPAEPTRAPDVSAADAVFDELLSFGGPTGRLWDPDDDGPSPGLPPEPRPPRPPRPPWDNGPGGL